MVVVTGASAGVGRAVVRRFARDGARIGLLARGQDGLEGARRDVEAAGGRALALAVDVANWDEVDARPSGSSAISGRSTSGSTMQWLRCSRRFARCVRKSTGA